MERGVVFSACELLKTEDGKGIRTGKWISQLEINYLCLYWDKLVSPTNNIIHTALNNEDELEKCGLLTRPVYRHHGCFDGQYMADFYAETHAKTIDILRHADSSVDWRMHFLSDQINLVPELSRTSEVIRFELANLLPVPTEDVHLHDILDFKERRKPELIALHEYLDELYLEIKRSGDINLQKAKALSNLKQAIKDIERLNCEVWKSPIKFSISTSFEFDFSQIFSLAGTVLSMSVDYPYNVIGGVSSFAYFLGGCIKIKPQFQQVLSLGNHKLVYISKGKSEGIIS